MIEREPARVVIHAVEAKQPAGGITDQHVAGLSSGAQIIDGKMLQWPHDVRTRAGDLDPRRRQLLPGAVIEFKLG